MASEPSDGDSPSVSVPEELDAWFDERAESLDLDREELLGGLLSAYRGVATADDSASDLDRDVASLAERVEALETTFESQLDDVRRRVLHVKRATDGKAPADHDHAAFDRLDDLEDRTDALVDATDALERTVEDLRTAMDDLRETTDATADDLSEVDEKLTRVAQVVVSLRDDLGESVDPSRGHLVDLKRLAAREGYGHAECAACGGAVYLSVLPEAACPHCGTPFDDIVERGALRNRPTLVGEEVDEK